MLIGPPKAVAGAVRRIAGTGAPFVLTGTTVRTALRSFVIPGGSLGPNGKLRLECEWDFTNNANAKTPFITIGGVQVATTGGFANSASAQTLVVFRAANSDFVQQTYPSFIGPYSGSAAVMIDSALDMTVDQTVEISATLAVATDVLRLCGFEALVYRGN